MELPCLKGHLRNVDGFSLASKTKTAFHKVVDVNAIFLVPLNQPEDLPRIVGLKLQCREESDRVLISKVHLELLVRDEVGVVNVDGLEQALDSVDVQSSIQQVLLHNQFMILPDAFDGTLAEDAGDDIQHCKEREGDVNDKECHPSGVKHSQRFHNLVPAHTARDCLEEREDGPGQCTPVSPKVWLVGFRRRDVIADDLSKHHTKDVDDNHEE
mmetsp:Transcript_150248/g.287756  ORF Transcript_150248/g.287756 Transcript_150248/m.287756 type:complete len:213 (+) Transcript_150248:263-901(+)